MGCFINWDAQTIRSIEEVVKSNDVPADGCIINWMKSDQKANKAPLASAVSPNGCLINWIAESATGKIKTEAETTGASAADGFCFLDFSDVTKMRAMAELSDDGCIVNWMKLTPEQIREKINSADGGCIINW